MWEPRSYNELPGWVKRVSNHHKYHISKSLTKYFYGKHYDYKVLYERDAQGKLTIQYWREKKQYYPKPPRKHTNPSLLPILLLGFIIVGAVIFVLPALTATANPEYISSQGSESPDGSSQAGSPSAQPLPSPTKSWDSTSATQPSDQTGTDTTTSSDQFNPFGFLDPAQQFEESPKTVTYYYMSNGRKSTVLTLYGGLSDYLAQESHTYYHDAEQEVVLELFESAYQDEYSEPILQRIRILADTPDQQAKVAISMVQHIPYDWDALYVRSSDWHYPYETMYRNKGVCADKSILLTYLLDRLGYDAVLFEFSQHDAVGIRCDSQYDFENTGYCFIETTRPTVITYVPDDYIGGFQITGPPHIVHIGTGGHSLDVSQEYSDAKELKRIESLGTVLDRYNYDRWEALTKKYDMQYET